MQFVLTTFGQNLFTNTGTPMSLAYVLGNASNYTPVATDTNIHGATVASGYTLSLEALAGQPVYPVVLEANVEVPPFGEVGLFLGADLVALGVSTTMLQNTQLVGNLSILCVIPSTINSEGFFTPVALSSQSGIDFLPSVDSLANAASVLNPGTSNLYGFLNTDLIALSAGQRWLLAGVPMLSKTVVASPIVAGQVSIGALLPGAPATGTTYYISIATGANAGLVRSATLFSTTTGPNTSLFTFNAGLPEALAAGDQIYIYSTIAGSGSGGGGGGGGSPVYFPLEQLTNALITAPWTGDVLTWTSTTSKWVNMPAGNMPIQNI